MAVLDYSERRQVSKNRPRKQPVGLFVFLVTGAFITAFGLGVLTGWLIFRPPRQVAAVAGSGNGQGTPPAPAASQPPAAVAGKVQDPPLTFYETLSKGNKAVIGSGLNPKKLDDPQGVKHVPSPAPAVQPQQKALPQAATTQEKPEQGGGQTNDGGKAAGSNLDKDSTVKKSEQGGSKFSVQIASYREKREAEAIKARVAARGLAAYVVELNLPGKGHWYRVRVGRGLDQEAANELAKKAGKGAMVVPE